MDPYYRLFQASEILKHLVLAAKSQVHSDQQYPSQQWTIDSVSFLSLRHPFSQIYSHKEQKEVFAALS
jgi:hypothetical protein